MTPGIAICVALAFCVALWPDVVNHHLERCILELQIMILNRRLKAAQWKLYKQLQKDHKERGWPELPPFKFTPIQHRGRK